MLCASKHFLYLFMINDFVFIVTVVMIPSRSQFWY